MKIFAPEDVDLQHLNPVRVWYAPKNISTEAVFVTPENIGKLALEFEAELYTEKNGDLYFKVKVYRGEAKDPNYAVYLSVETGKWLIPLRGELHTFPDMVFQNTFEFEDKPFTPIGEPLSARFRLGQSVWVPSIQRMGVVRDFRSDTQDVRQGLSYNVDLSDGTSRWFHEEDLELGETPQLPGA